MTDTPQPSEPLPELLDVASERMGDVVSEWRSALRPRPVGSPITPVRMPRNIALGIELIHEGWLLHAEHATGRLVAPDAQIATTLLVGDWCFAAGLCDVSECGDLDAIDTLALLIANVSARPHATPEELDAFWQQALLDLS